VPLHRSGEGVRVHRSTLTKGRVYILEPNKYGRGVSASAAAHQEDMDVNSNLIPDFFSSLGFSLGRLDKMDDDDFSGLETPPEIDSPSAAQGQMEKQLESLKSYLDALPYECETPEEMETKLEFIIGKIDVCVRSKNWSLLPNWSHLLHWYVPPTIHYATHLGLNSSQLAVAEISNARLHTSQARASVL